MTGSVNSVKREPLVSFMIYETEAISLDHICHPGRRGFSHDGHSHKILKKIQSQSWIMVK